MTETERRKIAEKWAQRKIDEEDDAIDDAAGPKAFFRKWNRKINRKIEVFFEQTREEKDVEALNIFNKQNIGVKRANEARTDIEKSLDDRSPINLKSDAAKRLTAMQEDTGGHISRDQSLKASKLFND